VVFAIAANKNKSNWPLDKPNAVFELARLWAPDGHQAMLTEAISSLAAGARAAN
jgi:hypothetical protein